MKIITWNVNGFRSVMSDQFLVDFERLDADVYCLQETRLQDGDGGIDVPAFKQYWNYAQRKGYSGTAVITIKEPIDVHFGIGLEPYDAEGRLITAEYEQFYLINCYSPHSAPDLSRLNERVLWDQALLEYVRMLDARKPVILCGDLNAAYNEADLLGKNQGMQTAGYTHEERSGLVALINHGFVDAYRYMHPKERAGAFAYRKGIRSAGLDYFLVSERFMPQIVDCRVHNRVRTSDHWPLELTLLES